VYWVVLLQVSQEVETSLRSLDCLLDCCVLGRPAAGQPAGEAKPQVDVKGKAEQRPETQEPNIIKLKWLIQIVIFNV
jgi:hypothetical protein